MSEPSPERTKLVFDYYSIPVNIQQDDLKVSMEKKESHLFYHRKCGGEMIEKTLLIDDGRLLFNPVEPINKPREITPFFLIELEQALAVKPKETGEIIVTFPVEIASIFVDKGYSFTVLDIFSIISPKYTLYGSPVTGMICRYWNSRVYSSPPAIEPCLEGAMAVNISNTTNRWVEVSKMVFNAHDMKIFYNRSGVSMKGYMKILSETTAETGFSEERQETPDTETKKAMELLSSRKSLIAAGHKLLMEEGI